MPAFDLSNYIDVQQRITRFWSEYPEGRIETNLMSLPDDFVQCRFKASIYKRLEDPEPSSTGWAFELAGPTGANRTSHEENCETSSIGRALANMGYATSLEDRPSREEMDKVTRTIAQPLPYRNEPTYAAEPSLISPKQDGFIRALMEDHGVTDEMMHTMIKANYHKLHLRDLTKQDASAYIGVLQALPMAEEPGITQEPQKGYEINRQGREETVAMPWASAPDPPPFMTDDPDRWTN